MTKKEKAELAKLEKTDRLVKKRIAKDQEMAAIDREIQRLYGQKDKISNEICRLNNKYLEMADWHRKEVGKKGI